MNNDLKGRIDRVSLVSLNLAWGFMNKKYGLPETRPHNPYHETEQHLTIDRNGLVRFNTFYIDGQKETVTPIRRQRFLMKPEQISRLFAYLHEIFDGGYPPYTITDGPTWHLAIANQQGQIYQYEGMMVQDEWLLGLNGVLHECVDRIDGLWGVEC